MKLILLCMLLTSCATPSTYVLAPDKKFIDADTTILGTLKIHTQDADYSDSPEIILFNDGQGGDYTIYETSSKNKK